MTKCEHGVYLPEIDRILGKAWACGLCYPQGHPERQDRRFKVMSDENLDFKVATFGQYV
jgi:hypothetical protein